MRMKSALLAGMLALLSAAVLAAGPAAVRKQVEASMLVTGHVLIEPDGSVSGWEIDQRKKLPAAVVELVERSASSWRFDPVMVDGNARKARARMSLRVVARRIEGDDDNYRVTIRAGYFGEEAMTAQERKALASTDRVQADRMKPPTYPDVAWQAGVRGTVYLVLKIDRKGAVDDLVSEQVNLKVVGSEQQMARMRGVLERSAISAARKWTFRVPTTGEAAEGPYWTVRVPVDYRWEDEKASGYGEWEAYVPGPRQEKMPWHMEDLEGFDIPPDALIAGEIYQVGSGFKLRSALSGG